MVEMKKVWSRPLTVVQNFEPNEYCASSCGEEKKVYNFTCDAPAGWLFYYPNGDGAIDGVYNGSGLASPAGWFFKTYHPCSETHEASLTDDFYDGFVDYNQNCIHDEGEGVIVWRGESGNNGHATQNLNMKSWVISKS